MGSRNLRNKDIKDKDSYTTPTMTPSKASGSTGSTSRILHFAENTDKNVKALMDFIKILEQRIKSLEDRQNVSPNNDMLTSIVNKLEELSKSILEEKFSKDLSARCQVIRDKISVYWMNQMNKRKKSWWHFYQNMSKANLYSRWIADYPTYIPLKFKPSMVRGEPESATRVRVDQARTKYHSDVDLLMSYSDNHKVKFDTIDSEVSEYIDTLTEDLPLRGLLKEWWARDVSKCEEHSVQLWVKREKFLDSKLREDLEAGNTELTKISWEDMRTSKRTRNSPQSPRPSPQPVAAQRRHDNSNNRHTKRQTNYRSNARDRRNYNSNPNYNNRYQRDNYRPHQSHFTEPHDRFSPRSPPDPYSPRGSRPYTPVIPTNSGPTFHNTNTDRTRSQYSPRPHNLHTNTGAEDDRYFRMGPWDRYPM